MWTGHAGFDKLAAVKNYCDVLFNFRRNIEHALFNITQNIVLLTGCQDCLIGNWNDPYFCLIKAWNQTLLLSCKKMCWHDQDLNLGPPTYHADAQLNELPRQPDTRPEDVMQDLANPVANVCYRLLKFRQTPRPVLFQEGSKEIHIFFSSDTEILITKHKVWTTILCHITNAFCLSRHYWVLSAHFSCTVNKLSE